MTDALKSLFDGTRSGSREQTVLTGDLITQLLGSFWGRTALDPCAPPEGPIVVPCDRCKKKIKPNCRNCAGAGFTEQISSVRPERSVRLPEDGTAIPWVDRTFVNPPYDSLEQWFRDTDPTHRVLWYVPSRTHRRWFRAWVRTLTDLIALNPQKFKGYANTFPAPLVLGYRGPREHVAKLRFLCEVSDLGESLLAPRSETCTL